MFFQFRKLAISGAVAVSIIAPSAICAAGLQKVAVPSAILKGAAVTKNRAFWKSTMPEVTLAGLTLGRGVKEVLSKWGNPTNITVGSKDDASGVAAPAGGPAYTPPAGATDYGALAAGINKAADKMGLQTPPVGGGGLPPLPGMPNPGMGNTPADPGTPGSTGNRLSEDEVCYTYKLKTSGVTLDFILTSGVVTQISVAGNKPWPLSKTRTGLQLGDTYALALWVCGNPENQKRSGKYLQVSYANANRSVYTFVDKKLVGVTIAMMPDEDM